MCAPLLAQNYTPFPGEPMNQRTRSMQERVEAVYIAGDLERALLIYEKDLAPLGDKYAQYMVGYMHLHAEGSPPDRPEALAWYRLAAERGDPLLAQVRDQLAANLSPSERARSDAIFVDLWKSIGDRALVLELIQSDLDTLREQAGTRIRGVTTSTPTVRYQPSLIPDSPDFYRQLRIRLQSRIDYLDARVEISDDVIAEEFEAIRREEEAAKQELASLDNL